MIELLYESATTRVSRREGVSPGTVVVKEHLGAHAAYRLANEKAMLLRLAGVEGIVQLAPVQPFQEAVTLQDGLAPSLAAVMRSGEGSLPDVLPFAAQLAQALARVHAAGVIHCDINPANILVTSEGRPLLVDFDLALDRRQADAKDGRLVGTLGYLAPEQSGRTGLAIDPRADLYALGATLYEMTTGHPPFEGGDALQLIHDHLAHTPVAPAQANSRVAPALSAIIMRLLEKAPERRYQSAEGLAHDLAKLQAQPGAAAGFMLGERDFAARLEAPGRLIGREAECEALRAAFAQALASAQRTVLVGGDAGAGKSALVQTLRPLAVTAGGWMVTGKADQFQRESAASGAFTQALRSLGRILLAEPADRLDVHRRRLLAAMGRNAALLTQALPELELLLGAQPPLPEVDPQQAQARLLQTAVDMLGAIVSPDRPLVVVCEDLQWAGLPTLRLFEHIKDAPGLHGLMLVGTWRNADAGSGDALMPALDAWRRMEPPALFLQVGNLAPESLQAFVGEVLRLPAARAASLARAVGEFTGGNPFDTLELLNALRGDEVLRMGAHGWQWDADAIRHFVGRGDVMDLLASRVARLPPRSRELLAAMGLLGGPVDLGLLQAATGADAQQLQQGLAAALEDGLLSSDPATPGVVSFRHDRVQQAVMASMDGAARGELELSMARRLAAHPAHESHAARLYLRCADLLAEPLERQSAAKLLLDAATRLAAVANYTLAEPYLSAARSLLAGAATQDDRLRDAVDAQRLVTLYNLGRLDEMDALHAQIEARSRGPLAMLEATCLRMRALDMRGRAGESLALGRRTLQELGLALGDWSGGTERLAALGDWVRSPGHPAPADMPRITDPSLLGIARVLSRMVRSAYIQAESGALVSLLFECQRLWVTHGACPDLVSALGRMGILLVRQRQDLRTGYEVLRHVVAVGETFGYEPQTSEARAIFANYSCLWFEPIEAAHAQALRAADGVEAAGDVSFACFVRRGAVLLQLDFARTIGEELAAIDAAMAQSERAGNRHCVALHMCERQVLRALAGHTRAADSLDEDGFEEASFAASTAQLPFVGLCHAARRAFLAMLLGDAEALERYMAQALALLGDEVKDMDAHLPLALSRAWSLRMGRAPGGMDPAAAREELDTSRRWIAARAADQPHNFLHLQKLVEAEAAWAERDSWTAAVAFDAAMVESESRQRPWHRALILERAALFHLDRGLASTGRLLLARARDAYAGWGARAKVERLEREHPFLRVRMQGVAEHASGKGSGGVSSDALDLMGVLQASRALSSETSMERLAAKVTEVLAALSGATAVGVLSWHDGNWWLLATADGGATLALQEAAARRLAPASVVAYTDRTGEVLAVDDVAADDRFARDPYFASVPVCSLLAVPIAGQGAVRAMLLLENRMVRAAFGAQRLDAVKLIAGQLAVSLANAQLYEGLEGRVRSRTRELEQMQAQLVAAAREAGKAEIANNVLHNVGNVLNSVNVSAGVVRRTLTGSRMDGLARAVALLDEHRDDIGRFMAHDPRGKALPGYLSELAAVLRTERDHALADLERLTRSVDHISYVVATQQSHAGPSSVLETTRAQELVEEALRLSADTVARYGVQVVRAYEDMPATALDRPRLLQMLVNIIANAAQAMEGVPAGARLVTLGTGVVRVDGAERLRITVSDKGEGIAEENLARIFSHGFTTRQDGHGFGLHASALAAMEMGGRLTVHSDGPGRGAVFTVELPLPGGAPAA